jgi:putative peptidoglycan lipid II flippase
METMPNAEQPETRTRRLAYSTLTVIIAFGIAKVISLAQTVIILQVFGISKEWDAYVTANRIPELIFTLIAGGALAHAFIPIFGGFLAKGERDRAWRTASHVINTVFTVTFIASAIVFIFAPWLVANVAAPGFDLEGQAQTVGLMRLLLVSTLIFSVSGIVMGILQSFNHFLLPALAPIMFDIGILIGVVFLLTPLGVYGIAAGAVLGAAMHLAIQILGLIRYRARWTMEFGLRDPELWRVIRLMMPRVAGLGVYSLNFIIMNNIASRLGTGSVSALDWGWRLMQIPQTLIGTAMGTVIFPTLAELNAVGDHNGKRAAMSGALRFIMIGSIPSAIGLILVGRPVIQILEGGAFNTAAATIVYSTLQVFALGMIVHSVLEIVARSFYADKDTLTPLWAALGGAAINLVLSFALSNVAYAERAISALSLVGGQFSGLRPEFGNVSGLAMANSFGVAFEVIFLLVVLRRRWYGIHENEVARTILKTTAASLVMGLSIIVVGMLWQSVAGNSKILIGIQIILETAVGSIVFLITAFVLKMQEISVLFNMILRRNKTPLVEAAA